MQKSPVKNSLEDLLASGYNWLRLHRRIAFVLADTAIVIISLYLAFWARFDSLIPIRYLSMLSMILPFVLLIKLLIFHIFRIYRFSYLYIGFEELLSIAGACVFASISLAAMLFIFQSWQPLYGFPRSIIAIDLAFSFIGIAGIRGSKRSIRYLRSLQNERPHGQKAIIVGAGDAGEQLARSLLREENITYWPVGFLDDDSRKQGTFIHSVPVLGPRSKLPEIMKSQGVVTILIAMPSASTQVTKETVEIARKNGAKDIKIVPFLSELYTGEFKISDIREVRPEDIMPREPVSIDLESVEHFLNGKNVLITGASGSIGSELCRQVLRFTPNKLIALDFDETGLFNLQNELTRLFPKKKVQIIIGNIRDQTKMHLIFQRERPHIVFHAAAYKHVPLMEEYPEEAAKTNVFGTQILIEEARKAETDRFVLISTDKAVNPVSVMGMTKRVAEIITLTIGNGATTRCIAVRFGNVLGSRGSVIPTFMEQIRRRGPVTVTHPEMKRYFMTIPEAVLLVLQAGTIGKGGEVFVLDMGKQVKILDIAKELIRFYGFEPDKDIPIIFTGVRPGEKLFEELHTAEEETNTTIHKQIYVAKMSNKLPIEMLLRELKVMKELLRQDMGERRIKETLKDIINGSETEKR